MGGFPLNFLYGLLLTWAGWQWRRSLSRPKVGLFTLGLLWLLCLGQGCLPPQAHFPQTVFFVAVLSWGLVVLSAVIFNYLCADSADLRRRCPSLSFLLTHGGLWLALWAGLLGRADSGEWRLVVPLHETVSYAVDARTRGGMELPFTVQLQDFVVETYANGAPRHFEATLQVDQREARLRVNHPISCKGYRLYLTDYSPSTTAPTSYCVLMVTRQPWRGAVLAGILCLLLGVVMRSINL